MRFPIISWLSALGGALVVTGLPASAPAATANLNSVADATLFQAAPNNNLGDGGSFMAGGRPRDGIFNRTRGLLRFDLSGLPANAVITSATLTLNVVRTPGAQVNSLFDLRRVLVPWGAEGAGSDHSGGGPAGANQVTWNNRFFGGAAWSAPGGALGSDFDNAVSAARSIAGDGAYTFTSATLLSDVQGWYGNPANNFGWALMSESETTGRTVRRFGSREGGAGVAPVLNVEFTVVPEPGALALLGVGGLALGLAWRRRNHISP